MRAFSLPYVGGNQVQPCQGTVGIAYLVIGCLIVVEIGAGALRPGRRRKMQKERRTALRQSI